MKKSISFRITNYEYGRLQKISIQEQRPISEIVRQAVSSHTWNKIEGLTAGLHEKIQTLLVKE